MLGLLDILGVLVNGHHLHGAAAMYPSFATMHSMELT